MGTTWRVLYAGRQPGCEVRAAIEARLADLVAQLSHWEPMSALSRFNAAAAGTWMRLPPDLALVVGEGLRIAEATGGAFDPTIGALVDLWGFGPPGPRPMPSDEEVATARQRSGRNRLTWRPADRLLQQPGGVQLDLSGIAKGYAVDALAELLAGIGIRHCLVEIGGELVGRGLRPDGDPWWVGLETSPGIGVRPLRLALHGIAVATSGRYVRGEHNIDPRSGRAPIDSPIAATVIAPTAMLADALASAILISYPMLSCPSFKGLAFRIVCASATGTNELCSDELQALLA